MSHTMPSTHSDQKCQAQSNRMNLAHIQKKKKNQCFAGTGRRNQSAFSLELVCFCTWSSAQSVPAVTILNNGELNGIEDLQKVVVLVRVLLL